MKTDRELLELAAKADGIKALLDPHGCLRNCTGMEPAMNIFAAKIWNPLYDDGDALRLAVKLGIEITPFTGSKNTRCDHLASVGMEVEEAHGTDPYAATRRAIVRAAAEIGKAMSGSTTRYEE